MQASELLDQDSRDIVFPCQHSGCVRTFGHPDGLAKHQATYGHGKGTEMAEMKCSECGQEFKYPGALTSHMAKKHGDTTQVAEPREPKKPATSPPPQPKPTSRPKAVASSVTVFETSHTFREGGSVALTIECDMWTLSPAEYEFCQGLISALNELERSR